MFCHAYIEVKLSIFLGSFTYFLGFMQWPEVFAFIDTSSVTWKLVLEYKWAFSCSALGPAFVKHCQKQYYVVTRFLYFNVLTWTTNPMKIKLSISPHPYPKVLYTEESSICWRRSLKTQFLNWTKDLERYGIKKFHSE